MWQTTPWKLFQITFFLNGKKKLIKQRNKIGLNDVEALFKLQTQYPSNFRIDVEKIEVIKVFPLENSSIPTG